MCGIVGFFSEEIFSSFDLIRSLKKLEYRGYDSAGISMNSYVEKSVGDISELEKKLNDVKGNIGIAHTRWATHGSASEENAHPHSDCKNEINIVHNGIIDNYISLKNDLRKKGHFFKSKTDSEIIAHFFEEELKEKNYQASSGEFFFCCKRRVCDFADEKKS